jgi:hypothetical protein
LTHIAVPHVADWGSWGTQYAITSPVFSGTLNFVCNMNITMASSIDEAVGMYCIEENARRFLSDKRTITVTNLSLSSVIQ